ncbi:MAG: hypothetical protein M3R24_02785 [Chloroflexota bacterium]|nr:hypothetical protein [Chloroflexota bacterium]PLS77880.1 MAG: hypothetical protein CYG59_21555 [Chloroflexota bacterium]
MPVVRRPAVFWLALLVVLLSATACGNAGAGAARPAATASGAEASSATTTATTATTTAKAPSTGASAAVAAEGYAALPQSKTPEGYYVLGDPNAPATMTFYSDFI